jgi:hypothetical protein
MNTSLSLSFELIYLLGWLLKHEKNTLDALIKQAVKNGLAIDLKKITTEDQEKMTDQLYGTVLDFLVYLEDALANNLDGVQGDSATDQMLYPALNKFTNNSLDIQTIKLSMQQARERLQNKTTENPSQAEAIENGKSILFEQLLKNWNPSKNETFH